MGLINRPDRGCSIEGNQFPYLDEKPSKKSGNLPNPMEYGKSTDSTSKDSKSLAMGIRVISSGEFHPAKANTQSYARRFFNFGMSYAITGVCKLFENGIFSPEAMLGDYTKNISQLEKMTGSEDLGEFLQQCSIVLADSLPEFFLEEGLIKEGIEHEASFLKLLTQSMITKLAVNVGQRLQSEGEPVTTFAIAASLTRVMKTHLDAAQEEISKTGAINNPKERAQAIEKSYLPVVDAVLSLAFPQGAKELPLRSQVQKSAWSWLRGKVLQNLVKFNEVSLAFQELTKMERMDRSPKTEFLSHLSQQVGSIVENEGPSLLAESSVSLAKKILEQVSPENEAPTLLPWLTTQIQSLSQSDNLQSAALWSFFGSKATALSSYILFNLSKNAPDQDAGVAVSLNMLKMMNEFYTQHNQNIGNVYERLTQEGINPDTHPEYLACFVPFIKMFENVSELEVLKPLLPNGIKEFLNKISDEQISKGIARLYQPYIAPMIEIYRVVENSSVSSQKESLIEHPNALVVSDQINEASHLVSEKSLAYLSKNHSDLAEKACDALFEAAFSIRQQLREAVIGEAVIGEAVSVEQNPLPLRLKTSFEKWMQSWIEKQINSLGSSDDPSGRYIEKFIKKATIAFFERTALHIRKDSPDSANLYQVIGDRLSLRLHEFIENNGVEIQEHFIRLRQEERVPEEDSTFIERFIPLCRDLVTELSFDGENAPEAEKLLTRMTVKGLSKLLASKFGEFLVPVRVLKTSQERLKQLFASKDNPDDGNPADQIDNLCGIVAEKIASVLQTSTFEAVKKWTENLPSGLLKLSELDLKHSYSKNLVKSLLLQLLVNYFEGIQVKGGEGTQEKTPLSDIPIPQLLEKFIKTLEHHLDVDAKHIQEAAAIVDPDARKLALRQAFNPLTRSLIGLMSPNALNKGSASELLEIPVEIPFRDQLGEGWKILQASLIPDLLASMCTDITTWSNEVQTNRQTIANETKNSLLPESCRVIGEWVGEFIPALLCKDKEDLIIGIYDGVAKYLASNNNKEALTVSQYIEKNADQIKKRLCEDLFSMFAPDGNFAKTTKPLTSKYVEAILVKLCSNLTSRINDVQGRNEEEQQKFMVNLGINLLKVANEHFITLNTTTTLYKKYAAYGLTQQQCIEGFKDVLHQGIPQSKESPYVHDRMKAAKRFIEKERRLYKKLRNPIKKQECLKKIQEAKLKFNEAKAILSKERQAFFKPFAEKLIGLSGLTKPEDLPVPIKLRGQIWELFNQKLAPMILEHIYEEVSRPETRVKMVISGLKCLNEALDTITPEDKAGLDFEDEAQRKLNKVCGELVLQLVQLVPQSMIQAAFKIDKFKILEKQSAEIVGKSVRKYLGNDQNLLKIMDKGLFVGMPALKPGSWTRGANGYEFVDSVTETCDFPLSEEALEEYARAKQTVADLEMKEMRKLMVDTTHRVMSDSIKTFFVGPYIKLRRICHICIDKIFGKYGKNVRDFFAFLTEKTIFRAIEIVFSILSYPFRAAFWFFMDIHIGWKADDVIKSLQLDIHENFLYKLTDKLVDALEGNVEVPDAVIKPIIEAAERRQLAEWLYVKEYIKRLGLTLRDVGIGNETDINDEGEERKKKADPEIQEPASSSAKASRLSRPS